MSDRIVIVTGSRIWPAKYIVWQKLAEQAPALVVHGGCEEGADWFAEHWCRAMEVDSRIVRAHWRRHSGGVVDPRQGPIRNARMLRLYPDALVLAFPYGKAAGTRGTIAEARKLAMTVNVVDPAGGFVSYPPLPVGS